MDHMEENQARTKFTTPTVRASSSPSLQVLRKKNSEVVCMIDLVNVVAVHLLKEVNVQKLISTTEEGLDVGDEDEKNKLEELKPSEVKSMKELGDTVGTVTVTDCIVDSLWHLTKSEHGSSASVARH